MLLKSIIGWIALVLASNCFANPSPTISPNDKDIVVSASAAIEPAVTKFVRQSAWNENGVLPRHRDGLCVSLVGLSASSRVAAMAEISLSAGEAGVQIRDAPCTPNSLVVFAADGRAAIRALAARRPDLRAIVPPWRWEALLASRGPTWRWLATELKTIDGASVDLAARVFVPTRIRPQVRWDVTTSITVIETGAFRGASPRSLGRYIAMTVLGPFTGFGRPPLGLATILWLPYIDEPQQSDLMLSAFDTAVINAANTDVHGMRVAAFEQRVAAGLFRNSAGP